MARPRIRPNSRGFSLGRARESWNRKVDWNRRALGACRGDSLPPVTSRCARRPRTGAFTLWRTWADPVGDWSTHARAQAASTILFTSGRLLGSRAGPNAIPAVGIHSRNPALGRRTLHILQQIETLRLEDQVLRRIGLQANDEIGHVVVRLPVVEIGNHEAESLVFHERVDPLVAVEIVRRLLFPAPGAGNNVVRVT
jgi:hypothetical protein